MKIYASGSKRSGFVLDLMARFVELVQEVATKKVSLNVFRKVRHIV
jgi:hypothetical protein